MNKLKYWIFGAAVMSFSGVLTAHAAEVKIPLSQHASLIRESLCRSNPADTYFGSAATVDAGRYHHASRALFGFTLPLFDSSTVITMAELVLPAAQVVGSSPATLTLGYSTAAWDEDIVSWNNCPALTVIADYTLAAGVVNKLDITHSFLEAIKPSRVQ